MLEFTKGQLCLASTERSYPLIDKKGVILVVRKRIKDNIGFTIAIVFIVVVVGIIFSAIYSLKPPDKNKMEKYFKRDNADIILITDYFIDSSNPEIYVRKSDFKDGKILTGDNMLYEKIENEAVIKAIGRIFKKQGYSVIGKNNNTIYFQKWSMFEEDRGIAYSINGNDKPIVEFLTKLEPLSKNGWYYYEADYNEWRNQ